MLYYKNKADSISLPLQECRISNTGILVSKKEVVICNQKFYFLQRLFSMVQFYVPNSFPYYGR